MSGDLGCGVAEGLLAMRVERRLSAQNQERLARHLATCADCANLARELEAPSLAEVVSAAAAPRRRRGPGAVLVMATASLAAAVVGAIILRAAGGHEVHPPGQVAPAIRGVLTASLGDLALTNGDPESATRAYAAALEVCERERAREPADPRWPRLCAHVTRGAASAAVMLGDPGLARARLGDAAADGICAIELAAGRLHGAARACSDDASLVTIRLAQGDLAGARAAATRARATARGAPLVGRAALLAESDSALRLALVAQADGRDAEVRSVALAALAPALTAGDDLAGALAVARARTLLAELTGSGPLARATVADLERAAARWPSVVELQGRLGVAEILVARLAGAPELAARGRARLDALAARGALSLELRGLAR